MTREEKREARIERYTEYARKAKEASSAAYEHSHDLTRHIPFGQPILVGHHSERSHRRTLERSWDAIGKSVQLDEKAKYYEDKAEAAANNDAIYLEDENAIEKLTQKIKELEDLQEFMKGVNKVVRSKKLTNEERIKQIQDLGISEEQAIKLATVPDCFGNMGFTSSFNLTNNNANLCRYRERLQEAIKLQQAETKEYEINGVKVVENTEENRLQLFFGGKPGEEVRKNLKSNGFRWSPFNGCWQSYLKSWQIRQAKTILEAL